MPDSENTIDRTKAGRETKPAPARELGLGSPNRVRREASYSSSNRPDLDLGFFRRGLGASHVVPPLPTVSEGQRLAKGCTPGPRKRTVTYSLWSWCGAQRCGGIV